jgi:Double zinc ribbon
MPLAIFGIDSDELNLVVNLLILFLVVLWLALIAWTYFDARRRIEDPVLVASATAASLFPFVGTVVYSILRPPEFLEDKRERQLEIRASEMRLRQLEEQSCPNCDFPVERSFLRCPNCKARIHDPCEACGKPIDPRWSLCPYCETPVRRTAPAERVQQATAERRRPRSTQEQPAPTPAPRQRTPKPAPSRQARAPRPVAQRATAEQRQPRATASEGPPTTTAPGEDEPRPAPAS